MLSWSAASCSAAESHLMRAEGRTLNNGSSSLETAPPPSPQWGLSGVFVCVLSHYVSFLKT